MATERMIADAVVVLGGHANRLPVGARLVSEGAAPVLVVFNRIGTTELALPGVEVVALRPDPYTTRGEARATARLAADRGWRSVVVVTSSYHLPRARLIFRRAIDADVRMAAAPASLRRLPLDLVTEGLKWIWAFTGARRT